MYLKKIIAQGFKSFADSTVIDLENNIAGIVGPNGSGKSNVVDSVRWVLGEQSVKSLRGEQGMTDVIFAGSKSRKASGVATVTLIFDNRDQVLPISFDEVSIKRRLYKDGTNEFFLNDEKCRLKDINEILMDSGISKESFNIISQGKIEEILSSKPENRRVIFEEAARVLKYKKRKEEALHKLDKTHDNMIRVSDIINELEKQVEPLKEQKTKALKYLDLNESLKELEISLVAHDITEINYKYQDNKKKIDELNKDLINISTINSSNDAKISSFKLEINKIDNEINQNQAEILDATKEVERLDSKKRLLLERKKYEVDNNKLHDSIIKLKEEELNIKNSILSKENEIKISNEKLNRILIDIKTSDRNINKFKEEKNSYLEILSEENKKLNIINIKIDTLNASIENNSTIPGSVKNILENPKLKGIHNTIGSLIEVEEKYSKAISIVLGASSSYVVVDDENCAKEAINYLKTNNLGRVTFFPLNIIKSKNIDNDTLNILNRNQKYIGIACDLVKYQDKYKNIICNQLGNVIVVSDIDSANEISKTINYKYRVVTLEGEIIHVGGSLTGGTVKIRNVITDKYELEKCLKEKFNIENSIKNIEEKINELDREFKIEEDKEYLINKDRIKIDELINTYKISLNELNKKLIEIEDSIERDNNTLNDTIDKEEEEVLNDYYEANKKLKEIETNLELLNNKKIRLSNELEEYEHSLKRDTSNYNEKNNLLHELEIEVNRADVKLDNLLNILNETYSITYEKAVSLYKLDIDSKDARLRVNNIKRAIKELGAVNENAPEEYDKISERYEFLIHQQEDLNNSEKTLLEILDEMDAIMKQEFMKTFKVINENFKETFRELFKGGSAELKLTDESNVLETGIEIQACPPGKTLKNINLLSGGEKTLTAISLLFAILKSKHVPFCILDEVEAALDEVNVATFGEYIRKLKDMTQFIVITHKKKTMEYADILYGITMQESGVSKLVSVKLEALK